MANELETLVAGNPAMAADLLDQHHRYVIGNFAVTRHRYGAPWYVYYGRREAHFFLDFDADAVPYPTLAAAIAEATNPDLVARCHAEANRRAEEMAGTTKDTKNTKNRDGHECPSY